MNDNERTRAERNDTGKPCMNRSWGRRIRLQTVMLTTTVALGSGWLFQAGCITTLAKNFNPCGTILNCDPAEYDLMMNDWPDWDLDPTCTIPGQCGGVFPYGGGGLGGTAGTTASTGGGTSGGTVVSAPTGTSGSTTSTSGLFGSTGSSSLFGGSSFSGLGSSFGFGF